MSNRSRSSKLPFKEYKSQKDRRLVDEDLSIIGILQTFGIDLKVCLNYIALDNINDDPSQRIQDYIKSYRSVEAITENTDESCEEVFDLRKSKIRIKFKCLFNHLEVINRNRDQFDLSGLSYYYGNGWEWERQNLFESFTKVDRSRRNKMEIVIDLRMKSLSEIVSYLGGSDSNKSVEEQILSKVVDILDVDYEKKHVYIRLKSFFDNRSNNPSRYFLMGKIDGSESCFILNMTETMKNNRHIKKIDQIYQHFTPTVFKDRIYKSGKPNLFHDCKQVGVYRLCIGNFLHCITKNVMCAQSSVVYPYDPVRQKREPHLLRYNHNDWCGDVLISDMYWTNGWYYGTSYGGTIDTGFYTTDSIPLCRFTSTLPSNSFYPEINHFIF